MYVPTSVWPEILPVVERLPVPVVFDHIGGMMADTPSNDPIFRRILALLEVGPVLDEADRLSSVALPGLLMRTWRRSRNASSSARRTAACGAAIGRTRTSKATCRTTAICSTSSPIGRPIRALRKRILVDNPAVLYRFND